MYNVHIYVVVTSDTFYIIHIMNDNEYKCDMMMWCDWVFCESILFLIQNTVMMMRKPEERKKKYMKVYIFTHTSSLYTTSYLCQQKQRKNKKINKYVKKWKRKQSAPVNGKRVLLIMSPVCVLYNFIFCIDHAFTLE